MPKVFCNLICYDGDSGDGSNGGHSGDVDGDDVIDGGNYGGDEVNHCNDDGDDV